MCTATPQHTWQARSDTALLFNHTLRVADSDTVQNSLLLLHDAALRGTLVPDVSKVPRVPDHPPHHVGSLRTHSDGTVPEVSQQ